LTPGERFASGRESALSTGIPGVSDLKVAAKHLLRPTSLNNTKERERGGAFMMVIAEEGCPKERVK